MNDRERRVRAIVFAIVVGLVLLCTYGVLLGVNIGGRR